jgi:aryl-alcohol dehydrogenase-like predicted oxidoreductase
MKHNPSRRTFLQAGIMIPAAGLVSRSPESFPPAPADVVYRNLGKTGLKVTPVGCGAGGIPDPDILARAFDLGVNYFDTARIYGQGKSEQILGRFLQGKRDKIVLASKTYSNIGGYRNKPENPRDGSSRYLSPALPAHAAGDYG